MSSPFQRIWEAVFKGSTPTAEATKAAQHAGDPTPAILPSSTPTRIPRHQLEQHLDRIADEKRQPSNWENSIVDLLKLLEVDSSLENRKELAQELGYKGPLDGSAEMNTWLHDAVLDKLAETGGVVPEHFDKGI